MTPGGNDRLHIIREDQIEIVSVRGTLELTTKKLIGKRENYVTESVIICTLQEMIEQVGPRK
jgi:hypothetical protein